MHIDLAHAAGAAVLIWLAGWLIQRGDAPGEKRRWDWRIFFGVFVVMSLYNLVWPFG